MRVNKKKSNIIACGEQAINGAINNTNSNIQVSKITLELDHKDAHYLCNILSKNSLIQSNVVFEKEDGFKRLTSLGEAIGSCIDHHNCIDKERNSDV